jgi:thioredoxin:protein disulfide reductase
MSFRVSAQVRCLIAFVLCLSALRICAADPFAVSADVKTLDGGVPAISVSFTIPAGHHLYADKIQVQDVDGVKFLPKDVPAPKRIRDQFSDSDTDIYDHDVTLTYAVSGAVNSQSEITVAYQGCSETLCFRPVRKKVAIGASAVARTGTEETSARPVEPKSGASNPNWHETVKRFRVSGIASGYLAPKDFLKFLDDSEKGNDPGEIRPRTTFEERGIWLSLLAILVSGLLLNLTPCVLPMIPINVAIIGAGAQAGSRQRGFLLGGVYGAGIAVVYGALGLLVILTGTRFGTLNSSPWFNFVVALLFAALGLGMFGVFNIDFSRFQGTVVQGDPTKRGGFVAAFVMGGIAALLAGACVAPAVISVLLLSAELYSRGNSLGLMFPFMLGIGMALPWPFAGAGLSFLPKPGRWMERVKYGFGVIIVGIAIWYAWEGYSLLRDRIESHDSDIFSDALILAEKENKPVFVDFWASWCKNCYAMDRTTFSDQEVNKHLGSFVKVRYRANNINEPATKEILDHFHIIGLPTYLVLTPHADRGLAVP